VLMMLVTSRALVMLVTEVPISAHDAGGALQVLLVLVVSRTL